MRDACLLATPSDAIGPDGDMLSFWRNTFALMRALVVIVMQPFIQIRPKRGITLLAARSLIAPGLQSLVI